MVMLRKGEQKYSGGSHLWGGELQRGTNKGMEGGNEGKGVGWKKGPQPVYSTGWRRVQTE